ncbi:hypothetical protein [Streptomyces atroolivaceus]|uniref:Uncharacterized protein n=1 Tax=Streptomyces atroolivaceus TaxID=66869 RepID=A0ABV9V8A1_STRAZ
MSEGPNPLPDLWPLVPSGATDWLLDLCGDGPTGFMPPAMPDAVWVLNAMYEHEHGPVDVSYDEYHQARPAEGSTQLHMVGSNGLDDVSIATGGGGRSGPCPASRPWLAAAASGRACPADRRPDGARRADAVLPLLPLGREGGQPATEHDPAPTEGSLDRETWNRLIAVLVQYSPAGPETRCLAYYHPLTLGATDFDDLHVRAGRLGDTGLLYDQSDADFSPSNLWAADRSWVLCTDYDLWATKVAGSPALITALLNDSEIEAVRLPWAH